MHFSNIKLLKWEDNSFFTKGMSFVTWKKYVMAISFEQTEMHLFHKND